jgi:hypothetical protein
MTAWRTLCAALLAILMVSFAAPAFAKPDDGGSMYGREQAQTGKLAQPLKRHVHSGRKSKAPSEVMYLPHPSCCPGRQFCGCGAAYDVFGKCLRDLWPSSAWYRFPRTTPARGMVAVRPGHVFVLKEHVEGTVWMVNDYNSGGHQSRYHARSIAGYAIVDPQASRMAMN